MKVIFNQQGYNHVEMTLNAESLDVLIDHIGEDQIDTVEITIRKPEANDEVH